MVLPAIVFDAALNVDKHPQVLTRIGTVLMPNTLISLLFIPLFIAIAWVFKLNFDAGSLILFALIS